MAHIHSVRQNHPLGFGHAVLQLASTSGGEPFVVMVPDEIVPGSARRRACRCSSA